MDPMKQLSITFFRIAIGRKKGEKKERDLKLFKQPFVHSVIHFSCPASMTAMRGTERFDSVILEFLISALNLIAK